MRLCVGMPVTPLFSVSARALGTPGQLWVSPVDPFKRLCMLMPLLVRLKDSEVEAIDNVAPQIFDGIKDRGSVLEEVGSGRLPID